MLEADCTLRAENLIIFDRASARSKDSFGRLHIAQCRIAKANVSPYLGREIPGFEALGLQADRIYMLYRDPAELAAGAQSFANAQLLLKHVKVTAKDPKPTITVGTVGNVAFDGKYLVAERLSIWDEKGILAVESEEARQLSPGYGFVPDMTPGIDPEGVAYDGVMRNIRGNHVTLVFLARQGSDITVNDSHPSEIPHMFKRPNLMSALIALGVISAPANDSAKLALDAQLASCTAKDAVMPDDEEDDPENPGQRRKKINPGRGTPAVAGGALATDAATVQLAVDAALKAGSYVTQADAQKLANDAASTAVARVTSLHSARKAVEPLVGIVGDTLDSAEAVYRFALEKEGVALDGVHVSAFPALVQSRIQVKSASTKPAGAAPSVESLSAVQAALPGLGRIGLN